MSVKLLTEHHLEFLSLKAGCTCSSESTLVKIPHCWKSHVTAHLLFSLCTSFITFLQVCLEQAMDWDSTMVQCWQSQGIVILVQKYAVDVFV